MSKYSGVSAGKLMIWNDILAERSRQDAQWGGPDHDDNHVFSEWRGFRREFEDRVEGAFAIGPTFYVVARENLIKIAALAVAQIESLDRKFGSRFREPTPVQAAKADAFNAVDHPAYYGGADNPYEAIKVIEAWGLDFCLGNTVKYISRAGVKDQTKEIEDLEKARWYLDRRIQQLKEGK